MQNKTATTQIKTKSRTDVQWVISSLSLAVTLGLWGVFASQAKRVAGVQGQVIVPQQPEQQVVISQSPSLLPGQKLLVGGTAPQPQQTIVSTKHGGGGGGGGGGSASTGSSHP